MAGVYIPLRVTGKGKEGYQMGILSYIYLIILRNLTCRGIFEEF
jgi:hypothetical protein